MQAVDENFHAPRFEIAMDTIFKISLADCKKSAATSVALSRRESAKPLRADLDQQLAEGNTVELNCEGADATQSFMDELVGILVLERGPSVLRQLRFRGCSEDMKAIINFVVSDRTAQFLKNPHLHAPR